MDAKLFCYFVIIFLAVIANLALSLPCGTFVLFVQTVKPNKF